MDTTPTPSSPASPFSALFDPNNATPFSEIISMPIPAPVVYGTHTIGPSPVNANISPSWTQRLSSSLRAIAEEVSAASQALAAVEIPVEINSTRPPMIPTPRGAVIGPTQLSPPLFGELKARMDAIEQAQVRLADELDVLRESMSKLHVSREKEKEREHEENGGIIEGLRREETLNHIAALEMKVNMLTDSIRLDQMRLYARLRNASCYTNKMHVTPLPTSSGKAPANFPTTKGEFEHLTKERYENLLTSYGITPTGDTAAKREACRQFIGLPPAS